jgi:anti-sigma factor RsiW
MNLSKDVIRDLLPAYVAGEASVDTRALVEQSLGSNPDLRNEAKALGIIPVAHVFPQPHLSSPA